jgi:hypothetical protein
MNSRMSFQRQQFDAKFWGPLIVVSLLTATFGCLGIAVVAQPSDPTMNNIISVNDALHQMEQRNKIRQGTMTQRIRGGVVIEPGAPEAVTVADGVR